MPVMPTLLSVINFSYNKETNCFSQYISELPATIRVGKQTQIKITNPKTKNWRIFKFKKADMDGSNEDTYGWNYESEDGIKLLIINT